MYHLGEQYLPRNIENKIRQNPYYYQDKYLKYVHYRKKSKQYRVCIVIGDFFKIKKLKGIDMLFLTLFYLVGILPKEKPRHKPLSPEMRQEVRKLEKYTQEIILIVKEKLNTTEDVKNYIIQTEKKIADVTDIRQKYRNKLRNCTDKILINDYKQKRDDCCTTVLSEYRKKLKIANYILDDTPRVKEVIKAEKQMTELQQIDINRVKK